MYSYDNDWLVLDYFNSINCIRTASKIWFSMKNELQFENNAKKCKLIQSVALKFNAIWAIFICFMLDQHKNIIMDYLIKK